MRDSAVEARLTPGIGCTGPGLRSKTGDFDHWDWSRGNESGRAGPRPGGQAMPELQIECKKWWVRDESGGHSFMEITRFYGCQAKADPR
jgi:hypothetical protein